MTSGGPGLRRSGRRPTAATPGRRSPATPGCRRGCSGKIGVAVSPATAGRVWALVEAEDGALFRSDDGGETWERGSARSRGLRTRPWYYMHVTADPQDADTVYVAELQRSGSRSTAARPSARSPTPHGDNHDLWIDPSDPQPDDRGQRRRRLRLVQRRRRRWSTIYNQPTAQFYHVTTDDQLPYRVYGSQQDNTAISLPEPVATDGAITRADLVAARRRRERLHRGQARTTRTSSSAGASRHRHACNDGMIHYDHRTGQERDHHRLAGAVRHGARRRRARSTASSGPSRSSSRARPARALRRRQPRLPLDRRGQQLGGRQPGPDAQRPRASSEPSGGPITRDNTGAEIYCTIFALAESPHERGVLWAGSDDGLVHLSRDGGRTWQNVTPPEPAGVGADQRASSPRRTTPAPPTSPPPLQARRHAALPLQDERLRRDLDAHHRRHPGRRVHPRHPRGPEPARACSTPGTETRRLRLVRRRRRLAAAAVEPAGRADPRPRSSRAPTWSSPPTAARSGSSTTSRRCTSWPRRFPTATPTCSRRARPFAGARTRATA